MLDDNMQRERNTRQVLSLVQSLKSEIGVTRLADITHLDNIGIPVYCSYRPQGYVLQANAGKGFSDEEARSSALLKQSSQYDVKAARLKARTFS